MSKVFRGGVPYIVDVNRLIEAFPASELNEGRVIEHAELESIISEKQGSGRYYGVVNSWIASVRNTTGIYIIWEPSVGLKVLDPAQLLGHGEKRVKQKARQTRKAIKIYGYIDAKRLDPVGRERYDHQTRVAAALDASLMASNKQMAIDLSPVKSLPKPKLIRDAS